MFSLSGGGGTGSFAGCEGEVHWLNGGLGVVKGVVIIHVVVVFLLWGVAFD